MERVAPAWTQPRVMLLGGGTPLWMSVRLAADAYGWDASWEPDPGLVEASVASASPDMVLIAHHDLGLLPDLVEASTLLRSIPCVLVDTPPLTPGEEAFVHAAGASYVHGADDETLGRRFDEIGQALDPSGRITRLRRSARLVAGDTTFAGQTVAVDAGTLEVTFARSALPRGMAMLTVWLAPDREATGRVEVVRAEREGSAGPAPRAVVWLRLVDGDGPLARALVHAVERSVEGGQVLSGDPLPLDRAAAQLAALARGAALEAVPDAPLERWRVCERLPAVPARLKEVLAAYSVDERTTHDPCRDDAVAHTALWLLCEQLRDRIDTKGVVASAPEVSTLLRAAQEVFSDGAARRQVAEGDAPSDREALADARALFLEAALALRARWAEHDPEGAALVFPNLRIAADWREGRVQADVVRYDVEAFRKRKESASDPSAPVAPKPVERRSRVGPVWIGASLLALVGGMIVYRILEPGGAGGPEEYGSADLAELSGVLKSASRTENGDGDLVMATADGVLWRSLDDRSRREEAFRLWSNLRREGVRRAFLHDDEGRLLATFGAQGPKLVQR